jgi:hypothetical protein
MVVGQQNVKGAIHESLLPAVALSPGFRMNETLGSRVAHLGEKRNCHKYPIVPRQKYLEPIENIGKAYTNHKYWGGAESKRDSGGVLKQKRLGGAAGGTLKKPRP